MDLGVVPDVNRQLRMEIEDPDRSGVRMGECELAQFAGEGPGLAGIFHAGLNDEGRALGAGGTEADEGAARGARMGAENLLTGLGEQRTGGRGYTFNGPAAEPEPSVRVEVAAIAHAMPDRRGCAGSNKGQGRSIRILCDRWGLILVT